MNPFTDFLEMSVFGQTLFIFLFILVAYFGVFRSGLSLAPWVPTKKRDLQRVNTVCDLKSGETYVEAGCGNAVVTKYIAKHNPDVQCIGIEYSAILVLAAKCVAIFSRLPNLKIVYGDALKYDFSGADVVYLYGLSETVNQKLLPKVQIELKPSARFISYGFAINHPNVQKDQSQKAANIYIYKQ